MADIVLDDADDVLESGIEIIARPPGKELRQHLADDRRREDADGGGAAAGDLPQQAEPVLPARRGGRGPGRGEHRRLAGRCREFLDRSQFIVITHKKRTMASADVLYGVTMQESGRRRSKSPCGSRTGRTTRCPTRAAERATN